MLKALEERLGALSLVVKLEKVDDAHQINLVTSDLFSILLCD